MNILAGLSNQLLPVRSHSDSFVSSRKVYERIRRTFIAFGIALLCVSCGGGGSTSPTAPAPTTPPTPVTPPASPAHTIDNLSTGSVGTSAATISWTTARDSTVQVAYGTSMALGSETIKTTSLTKNHSVTLSGLTDNTTYYFKARAFDADDVLVESTV